MSDPSAITVHRRVKALKDYIRGLDDSVLNTEGKEDLGYWLDFICTGWDSTILMQWYPNFSSVMGHYLSRVQERIDLQKLSRDKIAAITRRALASQHATKITEGQAKAACLMNSTYVESCEILIKLERFYNFLAHIKEGMDPNIVTAFGHNQRLEQKQDSEN